jgi:adenosylhomocysteine nucleosidase
MIRFVTALTAEATPIVERFRMTRREGSFPIYISDNVSLVVSGMGKRASAAATAYLHARTEENPNPVWVNVGIAGHQTFTPGKLLVAHTIRDEATGKCWFPPQLSRSAAKAEVITVEQTETVFDSEAVYDMEASGFYPTASFFSTGEFVQCLKIVSDNRESKASELTRDRIREVVSNQLGTIETLVEELETLAKENGFGSFGTRELAAFSSKWRFSATERRRLERLLTRWKALAPEDTHDPDIFREAGSGVAALNLLEDKLRELAIKQSLY